MKLKMIGLMFALSTVFAEAAFAEKYTCKNVQGFGTWTYVINPSNNGAQEKPFTVFYSGYSQVEKRFGDWTGFGTWNLTPGQPNAGTNSSKISIFNGSIYTQDCFQQTLTRWTCFSTDVRFQFPEFDIECRIELF